MSRILKIMRRTACQNGAVH